MRRALSSSENAAHGESLEPAAKRTCRRLLNIQHWWNPDGEVPHVGVEHISIEGQPLSATLDIRRSRAAHQCVIFLLLFFVVWLSTRWQVRVG